MGNKLIKIEKDGVIYELWALVKAKIGTHRKWQFDYDYINALVSQMESPDSKKVAEAKDALLFLNATIAMEMDGVFENLAELGVLPDSEFKKSVFNSRNATQRDLVSNNPCVELTDDINSDHSSTLGSYVDLAKRIKKKLRQQNVSVATFREELKKGSQSKEIEKPKVKKYSPEEIAKFQQEYDIRNKK